MDSRARNDKSQRQDGSDKQGGLSYQGQPGVGIHREESGDIPLGEHHDGSGRTYMRHKRRKLHEQAHHHYQCRSQLLKGLVIHINSITNPPLHKLKPLIYEHGGEVEMVLLPRVTHVICENLPAGKIKKLLNARSRPWVTTAWLMQSLDASRLLPTRQFIMKQLADPAAKGMAAFLVTNGSKDCSKDDSKDDKDKENNRRPSASAKAISRSPQLRTNSQCSAGMVIHIQILPGSFMATALARARPELNGHAGEIAFVACMH
jgi:hypothetical protein